MKIFRLNTLWTKMSFAIFILVVFMMSMVTYLFTISQFKNQRQDLRQNMRRIARQIATIRFAETDGGYYVYQDWIDKIINSDAGEDLVYIAVFDESDALKAFVLNYAWLDIGDLTYLTREEKADIIKALSNNQIASESQKDFDHVVVDILVGEERIGKVDVGFSLIEFNNSMQRQLLLNLKVLALFLVVGIIGTVLMSLRITKPLNKLSAAMKRVSKGDLKHNIESSRQDEIGQLAQSFNHLVEGLREKEIIEKFSDTIAFTLDQDKLTSVLIKQLVTSVDATGGALFLYHGGDKGSVYFSESYPKQSFRRAVLKLSDNFYTQCISTNCVLASSDAIRDETILQIERELSFPIKWIFPLKSKNQLLGLILLGAKKGNTGYSQENIQLLQILINQATPAIENLFLLDELAEQERLKRELEIAKNVQRRLLPAVMPAVKGLAVAGVCEPANEVGGDYFDFFEQNEHRLGIAIADVAGKGTFAAFYMAELKGMMTFLSHGDIAPQDLVSNLNSRLYRSFDRKVFATMIFGVLDTIENEFIFVRAGHTGLLRRDGVDKKTRTVLPKGMGLGLASDRVFDENLQQQTIKLNSGDLLVFYTDGITEAMNDSLQEYGEERLIRLLDRCKDDEPNRVTKAILADVNRFTGSRLQHDDLTMVVIRID
ncbi:SpoIIE family protein phosphatase [candidate division KSB1 bacterium]|nr:SpoIIE family protein phosphatase [candidate division KSB1 bacterium]